MARDHDVRLATTTVFAAQTDFTEAGELLLISNESQLAFVEDTMREQGYLATTERAGGFQLLRPNDLVLRRTCPIACTPSTCDASFSTAISRRDAFAPADARSRSDIRTPTSRFEGASSRPGLVESVD